MCFTCGCAGKTRVDTSDAAIAAPINGCGVPAKVGDLRQLFLHLRDCAGIEASIICGDERPVK
jgi:hypothetical protein